MNKLRRAVRYLVAGSALLLGGVSLVFFTLFLFFGSLSLVDLGLGHRVSLLLDAGLSLFFFLQHSGMVRRKFRCWLAGIMPEDYYAALYAIASGVALLVLIHFWQQGAPLFVVPPGLLRWSFRLLFWLAIAGFLWCGLSLQYFDPFGTGSLLDRHGGKPEQVFLTVTGPYRMVRHPLYLLSIVLIWSCPDLTTDRLLFDLLWTGWIVVGAFLEERDLVNEFGDSYREYQRKVPMLVPWRHGTKRQKYP